MWISQDEWNGLKQLVQKQQGDIEVLKIQVENATHFSWDYESCKGRYNIVSIYTAVHTLLRHLNLKLVFSKGHDVVSIEELK